VEKPTIGITIGDPASIGPEIVVKALSKKEIREICKPVVIGDRKLLLRTTKKMGADLKMESINRPLDFRGGDGAIGVIDLKNVDLRTLQLGRISKEAGKASIEYVERGVEYAMDGELDALVTAPINKESINRAGCPYIGHTELIGALTGTEEPMMMFWVRGVRIFFLTRHLPLIKAIEAVKKNRIVETTVRIDGMLRKMGIERPRIAIAALNPHASDGGLVGREENEEIVPAVEELQELGVDAGGPFPADSLFHYAFTGKYDAVLSLYHDQGHIAAKTVDFHGTVSVTLGLPLIRTSVDHGTAFDIAGRGIADSRSLEEAIKVAAELASIVSK
jgi:4-hydroxythreonine-4-phosphate dehydrogenase